MLKLNQRGFFDDIELIHFIVLFVAIVLVAVQAISISSREKSQLVGDCVELEREFKNEANNQTWNEENPLENIRSCLKEEQTINQVDVDTYIVKFESPVDETGKSSPAKDSKLYLIENNNIHSLIYDETLTKITSLEDITGCGPISHYESRELVDFAGTYAWKINFENSETEVFGQKCIVNTSALLMAEGFDPNERILSLDVKYELDDSCEEYARKATGPFAGNAKSDCLMQYAVLKKDPKLCTNRQIIDLDREDCLSKIAYNTQNQKICDLKTIRLDTCRNRIDELKKVLVEI